MIKLYRHESLTTHLCHEPIRCDKSDKSIRSFRKEKKFIPTIISLYNFKL